MAEGEFHLLLSTGLKEPFTTISEKSRSMLAEGQLHTHPPASVPISELAETLSIKPASLPRPHTDETRPPQMERPTEQL